MLVVIVFILLLVVAAVLYRKYRKTDVLRLGKLKAEDGEATGVADLDGSPREEEGVRVRIDDFLEEYIAGDSIPESVLMELQLKRLAGEEEACVSKEVLATVQEQCAKYWKGETERETCLVLEEHARDMEEKGELEKAIALYERNVDSGYPAYHSFDRLVTIYDERGDLMKKIEVLKKAIQAFGSQHPILKEICELKLEQAQSAFGDKEK